MNDMRKRHDKTPFEKDFDALIKKAYCGFEQLSKKHDDRMAHILAVLQGETRREAA